jgi:hypothetical protein
MKAEPRFLLESLSRWDMGWRLSQTEGSLLMPVPQDFHNSVEAMHHVKLLSAEGGCIVQVKISSNRLEGANGERVFEVTQPASANSAK